MYANIRDILGPVIGHYIADITQHDEGEPAFVEIMIEGGAFIRFPIGEDGFVHNIMPPEEKA